LLQLIQLFSPQPNEVNRMDRMIFMTLMPMIAQAHEGHGMEGASHYHATDTLGFVVFLFMVALLWWFSGRGK